MIMTTDNECTMAGWIETYAHTGDGMTLHISYAPDADTDGQFLAFCHDEQEMIRVNGWAVELEQIEA